MATTHAPQRHFPISAGILLGLGLGGFFDGIVLHQILQWHHMFTSAGYPADTLYGLEFNTLWDGVFHASTWLFTISGLGLLWRAARRPHMLWSAKLLTATVLIGFGLFIVEGIVDHHLLGLHHVNETVDRRYWIYWDVAFILWGLAMLAGGWWLLHRAKRETPGATGQTDAVPRDGRRFTDRTAP